MLYLIFNSLIVTVPNLVAIAFVILAERKILAAIQRRTGPTVYGWQGILQSFLDGFKLITKETILPDRSNNILFLSSAFGILVVSLASWSIVSSGFAGSESDLDGSIFSGFLFSIINIYFIFIAGWSSNSKYSLLGALRAVAQMISYEIYFGLLLLPIFFFTESTNFCDIVKAQEKCWFVFLFFPIFVLYFITSLAETNRAPFDLPEAEGELVAGFHVEYSALTFSFFFSCWV